jgi:SNF2 family DNA or RNA helicase
MTITADLKAEGNKQYIWVTFDYDPQLVFEIKQIPGFTFKGADKGGPAWRAKLDFEACKSMRQMWGDNVRFTKALTDWGRTVGRRQDNLRALHTTENVELPNLEKRLPELHDSLRPYQRVGAAFVAADGSNPLVGDEPRTGKTRSVIAGLFEAGIPDNGPVLVVAPLTALETVWLRELNSLQDLPVFVPWGDRDSRMNVLEDLLLMDEVGESYWLVVNPAMIQYRRKGYAEDESEILEPTYPQIMEINWGAVVADEVHKAAMGNPTSLTAKAFYDLKAQKRVALTGTPMGGMPIKLYGILHWLHPQTFSSKWNFARSWLTVESVETRKGTFKKIGKVQESRQDAFDRMMQAYMIRRTRIEVSPDIKEPDVEHVYIEMTAGQAKQYKQMALEAEVKIEDMFGNRAADAGSESIMAQGVLAEYTRLKQFSNAKSTLGDMMPNGRRKVIPTDDSNKLHAVLEYLEERGITKDDYEDAEGDKVAIFSQFSETINWLIDYLNDHLNTEKSKKAGEIRADKLTGDTPGVKRKDIIARFQSPLGSRVLGMTTTAGGVAIDLSRANTVIFMDETWNPDDQRQAMDRVISLQNIMAKTVLFIHSRGTVEEYIRGINVGKSEVNLAVLDAWRASYRKAAGLDAA